MSLKSWKEEYYPVGASTVARDKTKTDVDLLDHCTKKWEGALPNNLSKHEVEYGTHTVHEGSNGPGYFYFSSSTCALCQRYDRSDGNGMCKRCPLAQYRSGLRCYAGGGIYENVFGHSLRNPAPMLNELKAARQWVVDGKPERPKMLGWV